MRRIFLKPLKKALQTETGEGLHFLEIGAGTGATSRMLKLCFPKARITVSDLSAPYLQIAQNKLNAQFDDARFDFVRADAGSLPFKDQTFDAVISVFMFHELPETVRAQVIQEAKRVLKPEGRLAIVDSIQTGDIPSLEEPLRTFPEEFHEPFFRNYLSVPLEKLTQEQGFSLENLSYGFFSKSVLGKLS